MYEQKTYKCNKSTVVIRDGDILSSRCEVICSSDNVGLQMGVGVARSIHDKTGAAIDAYRKCFQYDLVNTLYVDATKGLEERKADILRYIRSYGIKTNTNR